MLRSATARRRCGLLIPSPAPLPQSPLLSIFQDVVRPADGVWWWDFRECLSLSHGEPLQGRWRADNPTARVGRLQSCRQTSAVESCCGAPSTGHPYEIWQWWLLSSVNCISWTTLILEWVTAWWLHLFYCWVLTQDVQYCAKNSHGDLWWSLLLLSSKRSDILSSISLPILLI